MHALYDVPAVIEHALDILRVDGAREMRIAVVLTIATRRADALWFT